MSAELCPWVHKPSGLRKHRQRLEDTALKVLALSYLRDAMFIMKLHFEEIGIEKAAWCRRSPRADECKNTIEIHPLDKYTV